MAVPGRSRSSASGSAPALPTPVAPDSALAATELFAIDAYVHSFDAEVRDVDTEGNRLLLSRTAFYPGGGGQPHDVGALSGPEGTLTVTRVARGPGGIWHWVDGESAALPHPGTEVHGQLDWARRHLVMRTHTALHILCGVIWEEFRIPVTGGNMEAGTGRLDFPLEAMSAELGATVEARINDEISAAREIVVEFLGREVADADPALIRTSANLIPREIDPLRIINIVGLDKQADGGTHVVSTAEVGSVRVTGTESKGRGNKRIRIAVQS